ncbi:RNA polymerase sigma factor [Sciscionella marina]|uniref:RNA polymerase sigma factor n=1 Tax=Sciscionella marina TaxID=508770 RepID=UPI00036B0203|nr:sigma-70 family RNA polymerase sigma factor [Sciscionella marina]
MTTTGAPQADSWELVGQAQQGSQEALAGLYREFAPMVYRFVRSKISDDAGAVEDIVQDTFVRALGAIGRVQRQGVDPGAWLRVIARNIILDRWKSARTRRELTVSDVPDRPEAQASAESEFLATMLRREILSAVRRLAPDHRRCLELRFVEGRTVAETASSMRRTVGATKALQMRAVRKLAEIVFTAAAGEHLLRR